MNPPFPVRQSGLEGPAGPSPDKESRSARKALTHARLLRSMIEVGARLGYADASVERVIEGTAIARSTFYEHFSDRDECFLAALGLLGERLLGEVEAAVEANRDEDAATPVLGAMVGFAVDDPPGAALLFTQSLAAGKRALQLREELETRTETALEEAWTKAPVGTKAIDLPARALIGGVFRLLGIRLRHGEAGLSSLGEELAGWVGSYAAEGPPRWRRPPELGSVEPLASDSLPSLQAPPPLAGGRGSHRLPPAEVARSQKLRILSATAKCSYEQGYAAVRVTDITASAQVSRNAFYAQFRDKAHAAAEANERLFRAAIGTCALAFFGEREWPERVWAGARAMLSFLALHPEDAYLSFVEPHAIGTAAIQHTYDRLEAFTLFMEEGYRFRPEAQGLPKVSSEALTAAMFELAHRELRERASIEGLLEIMPQLAYVILAPFMGPEGAGEFVEGKVSSTRLPTK
jgi:AcrR family transcriptional regulator